MNTNAQANLKQLSALLRQGEDPALEFKRSTGDLPAALCDSTALLRRSSRKNRVS